ncbi:MAG: amino acid ABC transporter ATP-binding protein [Janthinobacterium lividum]
MIEIKNLSKSYHNLQVLKNINAQVAEGEVVSILGPSGSGKSTLLRCLNLLDRPTSGSVVINGQDIMDSSCDIRLIRQKVCMVFQHFHLFPHMTVLENLTYAPINVLKLDQDQAQLKAEELLDRVGLIEKANIYPNKLSGGQKQRVAIARTLAMNPKVILFDEPTSALDPEMVKEVLAVIKDLTVRHTMTLVIVTHEMNFARDVSDTIWFLDEGELVESTNPKEFFNNPQTARAKKFLDMVL